MSFGALVMQICRDLKMKMKTIEGLKSLKWHALTIMVQFFAINRSFFRLFGLALETFTFFIGINYKTKTRSFYRLRSTSKASSADWTELNQQQCSCR